MNNQGKSDAPQSVAGEASASALKPLSSDGLSRDSTGTDQFSQLLADLGFKNVLDVKSKIDQVYSLRRADKVFEDRIFVRHASENFVRLYTDDIYWIKADGNYCDIVCKGRAYTVCVNLKQFEERLGLAQFIRVHRSYLVNLTHVTEFGEHFIFIDDESIPIGRSHREEFAKRLIRF